MRRRLSFALIAVGIALLCSTAFAQNAPPARTPMKVDLVISRYQGDKKVSSMPFTMLVAAVAENVPIDTTSLRVGMNVPVGQSSSTSQQGVTTSRQETRWVGVEIDCRVNRPNDDGRYKTWIQISDSSLYSTDRTKPVEMTGPTSGVPLPMAFRSYSVSNTLLLRENQAMEFSVGTDKIVGETIRAEVTVSVVK